MSKATEGQARSLIASFAVDTPWASITTDVQPFIELSPKERGARFAAFLQNGGRAVIATPTVIPITRNRFNPATHLGKGWSIIAEETDTRSAALTELDLTKVELVTMLKDGETYITGEEKLKRLKKDGRIRLDADVFHTLWENQHLIPESWKGKVSSNTRFIYCDGTVLRNSDGSRCVLYLFWYGGQWFWHVNWLEYDWLVNNPSAVLAT